MSKNGLPRRPSDRELVEEFELSGVDFLADQVLSSCCPNHALPK